ncbi:1-pyrroline-5-carboxylate dehydrogenase [Helicobacter monodelphidis]|uniref:bifunctional proline dehydrogenase/L-glutamate gamma-semialdehyde dehydrogenase n=1 Tax=Helicobacter sp. 15-1451 TaxID=2004995 RepID=UPI000DCAEFC8|nr:bifunctional proline dehydrogenase/L-glutamate gamma-semialdehyde dehydrogenase [Helicobacter sp. 15-1451]RAX56648.1 1-pyrroline-5-carboxylate dehydrogenase [Helicobacter sp. 15-1451]
MNLTLLEQSLELAEDLQGKIERNITKEEQAFHHKMKQLLENPANKVLLIELLDKSFRSSNNDVKFEAISHTLRKYGIADFFSPFERFLLQAFLTLGGIAPNISVPFFITQIRQDTANMVLDSAPNSLAMHNQKRLKQGITINVNLIGEEVLGEGESLTRFHHYEEALKSEYITYISIKITTIFSQINILDFEYSKSEIVKRLDKLYALAKAESKRQNKPKFINLDMEEFRDLELTVAAFKESITKFDIEAGIVLQAYLPDSFEYLKNLHSFSKERVQKGLPPIKVRIVKGANMEAEETIASQKDWALPTFTRKVDTDSNYNKMLHFVLEEDNFKYIHIGIASHNLFEIAYAYTLIADKKAQDSFTFEMLEGMSMQASTELSAMHKLILYAPVCDMAHFNNAIAYLVRRLDENTAEQNFMRHFFGLKLNDKAWLAQKELFLQALSGIEHLDNSMRRTQDRNAPQSARSTIDGEFHNEADTDFILSANRKWAESIRQHYINLPLQEIYAEGAKRLSSSEILEVKDKFCDKVIGKIHLANADGIKQALESAKHSTYSELSLQEIHTLLAKSAQILRERRGDLLGIAALEVGKTFAEIDAEVSEAIDFLEFYPHSLRTLQAQNPKVRFSPRGIGVVVAPWNFPIGISVGSISAALSGGNRVIYKPSSLSSLTGYSICQCLWDAGIPKDALIFLPSKGSDISAHLLTSDDIAFTILTGGEDTAYKMLEANPTLFLSAETGGKNATIVTKHADRDQAIKNVIHSAFSNSGQKCSATSLLILEEEVYNDENFKATLKDAAQSLNVGNPFEFKNKLGTLANKADSKLSRALESLESHEEWLLPPHFVQDNEYLMSPCIKYGTKEGDYSYKTELFAPVLSVMKAKDLKHAIALANGTGYGLTGALESLDEREWEYYTKHIEVGNAYINKPSTGAIVLRQPFGGIKKSAIGFGRKVGVYNYAPQFTHITQESVDSNLLACEFSEQLQSLLDNHTINESQKSEVQRALMMVQSYAYHHKNEFSQTHEYVKIRGEDNLFSYVPIRNLLFRMNAEDRLSDIIAVIGAAHIAGVHLEISVDTNVFEQITKYMDKAVFENMLKQMNYLMYVESAESCVQRTKNFERVRYHAIPKADDILYQQCAKESKIIIRDKPLFNGRFELLAYFNEKSCSISYHRYGNLGARILKHKEMT